MVCTGFKFVGKFGVDVGARWGVENPAGGRRYGVPYVGKHPYKLTCKYPHRTRKGLEVWMTLNFEVFEAFKRFALSPSPNPKP